MIKAKAFVEETLEVFVTTYDTMFIFCNTNTLLMMLEALK